MGQFFITEIPGNALHGAYALPLVALSYAVAVAGAFTGLMVASEHRRAARADVKSLLFLFGALAMGTAIWSMHFIGMLAFHMDMPMDYDTHLTAVSMLVAVAAAAGVFYIILAPRLKGRRLWAGAALLGTAICGMHYTGMAAMRMEGVTLRYNPAIFLASVVIAVTASAAALWIFFCLSRAAAGLRRTLVNFAAALVMGAAICGMHYTGMAAAVFVPAGDFCLTAAADAAVPYNLALAVATASGLLLGLALLIALWKRETALAGSAFPLKLVTLSVGLTVIGAAMGGVMYYRQDISDAKANAYLHRAWLSERVLRLDYELAGEAARPQPRQDAYAAAKNALADALDEAGDDAFFRGVAAQSARLRSAEAQAFSPSAPARRAAAAALDGGSYARRRQALEGELARAAVQDYQRAHARRTQAEAFMDRLALLFIPLGIVLVVTWVFKVRGLLQWQRELVESAAAAEQANLSKGEFLANMSHEIRTPLNGILGLAALLAESPLEPEQKESADAIVRSGETLLGLLNDILDFSKIEAGQLALEHTRFSLKETLRHIVTLLSLIGRHKGVTVECDYPDSVPADVTGDPTRVGQIFTNLMGNAVKFTERGRVKVSVRRAGGVFRIRVEDTGIGMSPAVQARLFSKFTQGDASITRRYGGTGLGLAITQRLVGLMQGSIAVDSAEGRGAVFTVDLPLAAAREAPARDAAALEGVAACDLSALSVMVVDDHPVNMMFTKKMLRKIGFTRIDAAVNGAEALRNFGDGRAYDLVLMDCQMPVMDGFAAAREIRAREKAQGLARTPIIAMTANAMAGDRGRCLAAGMDDYVSKPVSPARLAEVIARHLGATAPESGGAAAAAGGDTPVDAARLGLFTDGDAAEEAALAEAFLSAGRETLAVLRDHVADAGGGDAWRKAAHRLKGSSAQIGATGLAALCLAAEEGFCAGAEAKSALLREIEESFRRVHAFFAARATAPATN